MQQPIVVSLSGLRRMAMSCVLHVVAVVAVYGSLQIVTTTVTQGVSKTGQSIGDSLDRLDKLYRPKLEALLERPENLGAAQIIAPLPYVTEVEITKTDEGYVQSKEDRSYLFTIRGLNLDLVDRIRVGSVEASVATTLAPSVGSWFRAVVNLQGSADTIQYRAAVEPPELAASPLQLALITTLGQTLHFRHLAATTTLVKPMAHTGLRTSGSPAPGGPSPAESAAPVETPGSASPGTGSSAGPVVVEGAAQFGEYINASKWLDAEPGLREKLRTHVAMGTLADAHVRGMIDAIRKTMGMSDEARASLLVEALGHRYLIALRLVTVSPAVLGVALRTVRFPRAVQIIDAFPQSVDDGLMRILQEAGSGGGVTVAANPSASPGASVAPASAGPVALGVADYEDLRRKERLYQTCMDLVDALTKAEQSYASNFVAKPEVLDMAALREQGLLTFAPACPEHGQFSLKRWLPSGDAEIVCSIHGSRLSPGDDHKLYRSHFDAVDEARRMGDLGKVRDAIARLVHYLDEEPSNPFARVLLGEMYDRNEDYARATNTLKPYSDLHPTNVKLAFLCGHGFYARGNEILAETYLRRALEPRGDAFDFTFFEGTRYIEMYKLRDRAAAMLQGVRDKVKYADFVIRTQESSPSQACFNDVTALFNALPVLLTAIRAKPAIEKLYATLDEKRQELAKTPTHAKEERERIKALLRSKAATIHGFLKGVLTTVADKLPATHGGCPRQGIYFVNERQNLDCTAHSGILAEARLQIGANLAPWERSALSSALLLLLRSRDASLDACLAGQQKILDEHFLAVSGDDAFFKVPPDTSLQGLVKTGAIDGSLVDHAPAARLDIAVEAGDGVLECSQHPSFQRILQILPETEATQ